MEALRNTKLVEAAQRSAKELLAQDPELKKYPLLEKIVKVYEHTHFE
jgi:hypothetical protein